MKPFDLEKALAGEPVVTRDGRSVRNLRWFDSTGYCLAGVIEPATLETWNRDGKPGNWSAHPLDLFMVDKPKTTKRVVLMVRKSVVGGITGDPHQVSFAHPIEAEPDYMRQMSQDKWQRFELDLEVEE